MKIIPYQLKVFMESDTSRTMDAIGHPVHVEDLEVRTATFYEAPMFVTPAIGDDGTHDGAILYFPGIQIESPSSIKEVDEIIKSATQ